MLKGLTTIAFDADDTLWENEPLYREAERQWSLILKDYGTLESLSQALYATEVSNMADLGYGAKAFGISILETSVKVTGGKLTGSQTGEILKIIRGLLHNPATPLPGVAATLDALHGRYRLVLLTKGDLLDQEHKIDRSGLSKYFSHIEIVSDKNIGTYQSMIARLGIRADEFLMVGNSFKSDIAPVLELGGWGAYVPFRILWQLEHAEEYEHERLLRLTDIGQLLEYL